VHVSCELVISVNLSTCDNCELVILRYFHIDMFIDCILIRLRLLPMYFLYRTFIFDISEIPISFPFP
jgi:hypothetical protein